MTPLAFATRATVNALNRQPRTASFFLVRPRNGVSPAGLAARIERAVPGVSALTREEAAANDRSLFTGAFKGTLLADGRDRVRGRDPRHRPRRLQLDRGARPRVRDAEGDRPRPRALFRLVGAGGRARARGHGAGIVLAFAGVRAAAALAPKYLIAIGRERGAGERSRARDGARRRLPAGPLPRPPRPGDRVPAMSVPVARRQLLARKGRTFAGLAGIALALLLVLALKAIFAGMEQRLTATSTAAAPT